MDEDILTLGMRADEVRRQVAGPRVWYQRVHILHAAEVRPGVAIPNEASEVRVYETPERLEDALEIVRILHAVADDRPVVAFSMAVLAERARSGWGELGAVLRELRATGLRDVAELPADLIDDLADHVHLARASGLAATRVTIANPLGERRTEILEKIRRCKAKDVGAIGRVAPLPRNAPQNKPTTGYEDVRMVSLARLAFNEFYRRAPMFIEVDWVLYGPKLAQVALTFGADFLDAVPATSDMSLGRRRETVEEVVRNIRAAGFEPEEYRPSAA